MSEEQDRISSLPDEILHQILSFLPTKHSIQTSILSKRWVNLWKFTPVIDITMTGHHNEFTEFERTFIDNTLTQHQALKLHRFSLDFFIGSAWYPERDVQRCIEFAISRQVQILSVTANLLLGFLLHEDYYVLPDMFYSHVNVRSLEQVSLMGFFFNPNLPCVLLPFASMKTLCFFDCAIDDETLKGFLSNCPVLESLKIDHCHRLRNFKASWCRSTRFKHLVLRCLDNHGLKLEIDVSSLSTFKYWGDLMWISSKALPSIVEATVFQWRSWQNSQEFGYIRTWLRNLVHVKKLGVNSWFIQFLDREPKMKSNGWKFFENLKVFSWFGPLAKECDFIALIDFLGHCPLLEKIEIDFRSSYWEESCERNRPIALECSFIELENGDEQVTVGFLHNVKEIMVHHFFGYKSEIELIKHLLQKAVVLETLCLTYHRLELDPEYYDDGRPKELVEEEIFSLPRASSLVHILFHDTHEKFRN